MKSSRIVYNAKTKKTHVEQFEFTPSFTPDAVGVDLSELASLVAYAKLEKLI